MSAHIPDWLDPRTLRWLADREQDISNDCAELGNERAMRVIRGEEPKVTETRDEHVARCWEIARAKAGTVRWLRHAATRIERRRTKGGAR